MTTTMLSESLTIFGDGMSWPPSWPLRTYAVLWPIWLASYQAWHQLCRPDGVGVDWPFEWRGHVPATGTIRSSVRPRACYASNRARRDGRPRRPRDRAVIALRRTAIAHVAVAPIGSLAQSVAAPASLFPEDMFQELWWAFG